MRAILKDYVEERIAYYAVGLDNDAMLAHYEQAHVLYDKVWALAARYTRSNYQSADTELLQALNEMINICNTRKAANVNTIPTLILVFLPVLCVVTSFLLGYGQRGTPDWLVIIGFSVTLSATSFIILDLDRPRSGFITNDKANLEISGLRKLFEER